MKIIIPILFTVYSTLILAGFKSTNEASAKSDMLEECLNNKLFTTKEYTINCNEEFHHYNAEAYEENYDAYAAKEKGKVRISEFNALHPGMDKTPFKDFKKVAQVINEFDLVGVTELIPIMGKHLTNNYKVIRFKSDTPREIDDLDQEITDLESVIKKSKRKSVVKERDLRLLNKKRIQLKKDLKKIDRIYRFPGYVQILDALHKLKNGKTWALILSPQGEGPETTNTMELVGYFYRSSVVQPKTNKYCGSYACILAMDRRDMGVNLSDAISRRPFMADFESGNFSFSLITSHIIFDSPKSSYKMEHILSNSFGVDTYKGLGKGLTKANYARFAEVKFAFDFIKRNLQRRGHEEDIIYMGDLNLEKSNPFWHKVLSAWPGSQIFIDKKTSVSKFRVAGGKETFGKASNYDHFIFDPVKTSECVKTSKSNPIPRLNGGVLDFTKGKIGRSLNNMYNIRDESDYLDGMGPNDQDFDLNPRKFDRLMKRYVYRKLDKKKPTYTIGSKNAVEGKHKKVSSGIVIDTKADEKYAQNFENRVLRSQLFDNTYYYYYVQLLSDHYPIYMNCKTDE